MKRLSLFFAVLALGHLAAQAETAAEARQKKALEALRQRVAEEDAKSRSSVFAPLDPNSPLQLAQAGQTPDPSRRNPSYAEMEKLYLNGKISKKQYERYLKENPVDPAAKKQVVNPVATPGKAVPLVTAPAIKATPVPPQAVPAPDGAEKLNDVEAKMEELIRQKEARDKALKNAPPAPEPKTKREKLNALLKLFVDDKITEQEYNQRRAKILEEPGE